MNGTPDFQDLDSDGDGCADAIEAGTDTLGTSNTDSIYVAGTVDTCGLLMSGISGICSIPTTTDWIDDSVDKACDCDWATTNGIDVCQYIMDNPTSSLVTADCDSGGIDNLTECQSGQNPLDSLDDCQAAIDENVDICALLDPDGDGVFDATHPLANLDCDGGGISNIIECQSGQNPLDSLDDCQAAIDENVDICALLDPDGDGVFDATHPLANLDCDGGGISNIIECQSGQNPLDSLDDCQAAIDENVDICALLDPDGDGVFDATHPLANLDCDGGGISNIIECQSCLLYTSPSPRDATLSRMPSSA